MRQFDGSPAGIGGGLVSSNSGLNNSFGNDALGIGDGLASENRDQSENGQISITMNK